MKLTDHDNVSQGLMFDPSRTNQSEYYRLYAEIEAAWPPVHTSHYVVKSTQIHAEVVRRMQNSGII